MIRNSNLRSVNLLSTIKTDSLTTNIYNQVAALNSSGILYGIASNPSNFLKDNGSGSYTFSQITSDDVQFKLNSNIVPVTDWTGTVLTNSNVSTTQVNYLSNVTSDIQTQFNNTQPLLTAANKLDMAYVGSGNVTSDELDMNIGNTTFNIYNTFLSVTGSVDSLTQNKKNLFLNNISSTLTSNVANYNYDFRRSDTNGQNFYIGNSNISTTATSNLYLSGPNTNSAFYISVGNGNTTLTHDNSGSFVFNSLTSQNMYFQFNGVTNLGMSSTSATFYNNVYING